MTISDNNKQYVFIMIGISASGKSTKAKELAKEYDAVLFSSDEYRVKLFNDVNEQSKNNELFETIFKDIKESIDQGNNIVFDATNLGAKRRIHFINHVCNKKKHKNLCVVEYVFPITYELACKRNSERDRRVPEEIIRKQCLQFMPPIRTEEYDNVIIVPQEEYDFAKALEETYDFEQKTPYHKYTLGEHTQKAFNLIVDLFPKKQELILATLLHDIGKPLAEELTEKEDGKVVASFKGHQNYGAMLALFLQDQKPDIDVLKVSRLVYYHMSFYQEKSLPKVAEQLGVETYTDLVRFNVADRWGH